MISGLAVKHNYNLASLNLVVSIRVKLKIHKYDGASLVVETSIGFIYKEDVFVFT